MTLTKLASLAGVSVSTASKAFSGSPEISESTRNTIFEIARQHGCFDKYSKNRYEKTVIAIIVPEINSEYYFGLVMKIQSRVEKSGGMLLISTSNFSQEATRELFRYYTEFCKVDGIIIVGCAQLVENNDNFPVVVLGSESGKNVDTINFSQEKAFYEAIKLLVMNGHERIAFIGEPLTVLRSEIFVDTLLKCGISPRNEYILSSCECRFEDAGKECAEKLLSLDKSPTAIVCAYDYIALGAMDAINEHGLRIPEDISLIGVDNINFTALNGVSLTSIGYDTDNACDIALSLLKKKMKNEFYSASRDEDMRENINIEASLIVRGSVSAAKE